MLFISALLTCFYREFYCNQLSFYYASSLRRTLVLMNILRHISAIAFIIVIASCNNNKNKQSADTTSHSIDSTNPVFNPHEHSHDTVDVYSNETFKDVVLKKTGETIYEVHGKARVFEASYHYLVKDGNEIVTDGHGTTDAGAPAFGNFNFTVNVKKKTATEALYLVLFEVSAKDGSRQHELPIPLK